MDKQQSLPLLSGSSNFQSTPLERITEDSLPLLPTLPTFNYSWAVFLFSVPFTHPPMLPLKFKCSFSPVIKISSCLFLSVSNSSLLSHQMKLLKHHFVHFSSHLSHCLWGRNNLFGLACPTGSPWSGIFQTTETHSHHDLKTQGYFSSPTYCLSPASLFVSTPCCLPHVLSPSWPSPGLLSFEDKESDYVELWVVRSGLQRHI